MLFFAGEYERDMHKEGNAGAAEGTGGSGA